MIDLIAHIRYGCAANKILDLADEIDARVFSAAAPGESKLTARNLYDDRNEVLGAVELEVINLHGDGQIGDGIFQHQGFFKLALAIDFIEFLEYLVRIIALAIVELGFLIILECN